MPDLRHDDFHSEFSWSALTDLSVAPPIFVAASLVALQAAKQNVKGNPSAIVNDNLGLINFEFI